MKPSKMKDMQMLRFFLVLGGMTFLLLVLLIWGVPAPPTAPGWIEATR